MFESCGILCFAWTPLGAEIRLVYPKVELDMPSDFTPVKSK